MMSDLALYRSNPLAASASRIQLITEATKYGSMTIAGLHEYATQLVKETLTEAARLMPANPTPQQVAEVKVLTQAYLNQIEGIGYSACQRIMSVVDSIALLPA